MAKMKYWNGTIWEFLDAKDADTLDGKHYSDIKNEIEIKYATASGTNIYTVTISGITAYTEGLSVKIKFTNANTGASTLNINGLGAKNIVKSNGNPLSSGNIKAGQICHLVYTGSVFQLLGEGGEYGTAQPQHVLEGYTIGTEEGIKNGTMTNYGSKTFTPSDSTQKSGAGYYSSITVNPRPTLSGNAGTSQVLSGYTFYSNNYTKQTGTMPNQGRKIITPGTTNIAIPRGYHDGTGYVEGSINLISENIKEGVNIFGIIGSLEPKKYASGTFTTSYYVEPDSTIYFTVTNSLSFTPIVVAIDWADSHSAVYVKTGHGNIINPVAAVFCTQSVYTAYARVRIQTITNGFGLDFISVSSNQGFNSPSFDWIALG